MEKESVKIIFIVSVALVSLAIILLSVWFATKVSKKRFYSMMLLGIVLVSTGNIIVYYWQWGVELETILFGVWVGLAGSFFGVMFTRMLFKEKYNG